MTHRVSPISRFSACYGLSSSRALAILKPAAIALSTVTAVLQFSTILALVALGQALVIVCGGAGIDISVWWHGLARGRSAMLLVKAGFRALCSCLMSRPRPAARAREWISRDPPAASAANRPRLPV